MNFEIPSNPNKDDDEYIIARTREYNAPFVVDDYAPLSIYCRCDSGDVVGGLTGKTGWNYLGIGFLWVEETHRMKGLAAEILRRAEAEARKRGCEYAMLDTYEFQALGFYLKQGYQQFGRLEGYCGEFARHFLRKKL